DIEPHTASHPKLHQVSPEDAEREIKTAKLALEQLLGKECRHLAYPKGRHNEAVRAASRRAGITNAYTTEEGLVRPGDDALQLHRNGINRTVTLAQFRGIAGWGRLSRARFLRMFRRG